jgi:hypothetical protein
MSSEISHSSKAQLSSDFLLESISKQDKKCKVQEVAKDLLSSQAFFAHSEIGLRGACFAIELAKMPEGITSIIHAIHEHFHHFAEPILENLHSFSENIDKILKPLESICEDLALCIESDLEVYQEKKKSLFKMIPLTRRLIELTKKSQQQVLKLQSISFNQGFEGFDEILSVVAFARVQEIDVLNKQIQILRSQENLELQMIVDVYSLKLEEEAQRFDQLLKLCHLLDEEKADVIFRKTKLKIQQRKENEDLHHLSQISQKEVREFLEKMGGVMIEHESIRHKIDVTKRQNILEALHERVQPK